MATTPCPYCAADVPVQDEATTCPACGGAVRFIDAPEVTCASCGDAVPVQPGKAAVRCRCGHVQAVEDRPLRFMATCPRCSRKIDVPQEADRHVCPHCKTEMTLQDTF